MLDHRTLTLCLAVLLVAACSSEDSAPYAPFGCYVGAYVRDDGRVVDVAPLSSEGLRWRADNGEAGRIAPDENGLWAGTVGWTAMASPARIEFDQCPSQSLTFTGLPAYAGAYKRLTFDTTDTEFTSDGLTLAGRLVLPPGRNAVPIAVLIHGSERTSARDYNHLQRLLPALGVGAFVYDKRGTGGSAGDYTQDFERLADDAAAALAEARRLAGDRAARVGYQGGSQGGWVAPLAATRSNAAFVIASFGMLESPLTEDAMQAQADVRALGYDAEVLAKVKALTDATGRLLASDFEEGAQELEAMKTAYGDEPWFAAVQGEISGYMLSSPLWGFRFVYDNFVGVGTPWGHEPMPVIRSVDVPVLWVIAADDREAPPEGTVTALAELQSEGRDIAVAIFPDTDHGILNYVENDTETGSEREMTRYAEGYFRLLADWILEGTFRGTYGDAALSPSPSPSPSQPAMSN